MDKLKEEYITKLKHVVLAENGVNLDELDRYCRYLDNTDNTEELQLQAEQLMQDISGRSDGKAVKGKLFKL